MKPREFWIEFGGDPSDDKEVYKRYCAAVPFKGLDFSDEVVHCVEYSALEQEQQRSEKLLKTLRLIGTPVQRSMGTTEIEEWMAEVARMAISEYEASK